MSTKAYFVSDIHLKSKDEKNAQVLLRFLRALLTDEGVTHLFLLGDIFDFWVSDHTYFIEKFHPIVEAIDRLVQRGVSVIYFEGNHDLHLEKFWQRKLGISVIRQPEYFYLDNLVIRAEHGDLIDPEDYGYRFLKSILNTKATKLFADHMHESIVSCLGEKASQASRHYTSNTKTMSTERMVAKMHLYAKSAYQEKPFDFLISGHVHIRDDFSFKETGEKTVHSVNLGSWFDQPVAYLLTPQKQEFLLLV